MSANPDITELDELAEINEIETERYLREQARRQREREKHNEAARKMESRA